jgi:small Trp-rich protein
MPLIIIIVLLSGLKYFEIGPFTDLSWWWVAALMALAFVWFEFGERLFGMDKRRAHEQLEKMREQRVKKNFEGPRRKR